MAMVGVGANRKGLRFGSAIIMLVAVFKVFLFDTSSLEGFYRVLSLFGLGAAAASFAWFTALGAGARKLAPILARPIAWRVLDVLIAVVMTLIAISLVFN